MEKYALVMKEALERAVEEYMLACGVSSDNDSDVYQQAESIRDELLSLSFGNLEVVEDKLAYNEATVEALLSRRGE